MDIQNFSKNEVESILTSLGYFENFKKNYLEKAYKTINYGKRAGEFTFIGFFDSARNYPSYDTYSDESYENWFQILNSENSTEEELFCTVLEIFVWGGVLTGNVKKAVDLYKSKKLKNHIKIITNLLIQKHIIILKANKKIIENNNEIEMIWSSGWTKVYSFINSEFVIYDSRVSAFLNHTLTYNIEYDDEQMAQLKLLSTNLFNFEGALERERLVDKKYGFKNYAPDGINGFNSNLVASWIIQLLKEKLYRIENFRLFERAFFMLGFDLKQIK